MHILELPVINDLAARAIQVVGGRFALPPGEVRAMFADLPGVAGDITVPTRWGPVACSVYEPADVSGPPPIYLNFHGGGYVVAHPESDDHICRHLAATAGVLVINVDYAVAPQARFPVATDQAFDVLTWVVEQAGGLGCDGDRLAVGGQSAGGAIATAAARQARDAAGPPIALQILNYPPLDLSTPGRDKRALATSPVVAPWMARIFDTAYAPDAARTDPLVSPASLANLAPIDGVHPLAGMPPALVVTSQLDLLCAEGNRYAAALQDAGVQVVHREIEGADHAHTHRMPAGPIFETLQLMTTELRRALTRP